MYATPSDVITRIKEREMEQVQESDLPDPADLRLIAFCKSMSSDADTFIAKAYPLPLPSVPDALVQRVADMVRYKMHPDQRESGEDGKSRVRIDYEDAIEWLKDIANGDRVLVFDNDSGGSVGVDTSSSPHAVKTSSRIAVVASPVAFTDKVLGKMRVIK